MAFNPSNLFATAARDKAFSRFDYETDDDIDAVLGPEYFRPAFFRLRVGDRIDVSAVSAKREGARVVRECVVDALEHPDVKLREIKPAAEEIAALKARVAALEQAIAPLMSEQPEQPTRKTRGAA